jgi:hypothetical protein
MSKLTTKTRNSLNEESFALPGRRYPIEDANHARNALARVSQFGTEYERTVVKAKVKKRFPKIHVG